jgi:hypothetical protein
MSSPVKHYHYNKNYLCLKLYNSVKIYINAEWDKNKYFEEIEKHIYDCWKGEFFHLFSWEKSPYKNLARDIKIDLYELI